MKLSSELRKILKADPTAWLLEEDNPSVRYFTLIDMGKKSGGRPEVMQAKQRIMDYGTVPRILSQQKEGGYWDDPQRFYSAKYRGTVWQLIILAQLGADGSDDRIKRACEFIFDRAQDTGSGGFSYKSSGTGGTHSGVFPCLTANLVWSLIRLGYLEDQRVSKAIDWITTYQRFDDGIKTGPAGWPYDRYKSCWGRHSCHMGVVKSIKALSGIPIPERTREINNTIKKGAEYLLRHHIFRRSHDLKQISKPKWLKFGFPLMWNTDVLEILEILTALGYRDKRMQESVDLLVSKQDDSGRWKLEETYNGRFQVNIENKGRPSKWITYKALKVLSRLHGNKQAKNP